MSEMSNMEKLEVRRRNIPAGEGPDSVEPKEEHIQSRSGDVSESDNVLDSDHVCNFLLLLLLIFVVFVFVQNWIRYFFCDLC